jgi:hypothetical protein
MTKKDRSPPKNSTSPNPRPKQRNKTPPPPPSASKDQDPAALSIVSTPPRNNKRTNFYASLQDDPSDDSKSTLNPDDESLYESAGEGSVISTPNISNKMEKNSQESGSKFILNPVSPKESIRRSAIKSPTNPIAAIPPSDMERHRLDGPIYASDLEKVAAKIFATEDDKIRSDSELHRSPNRKKKIRSKQRNPKASKQKLSAKKFNDQGKEIFPGKNEDSSSQESIENEQVLAEQIFGSELKPKARVNPYNPAARNPENRLYPDPSELAAAIKVTMNPLPLSTDQSQKLTCHEDVKPTATQHQPSVASLPPPSKPESLPPALKSGNLKEPPKSTSTGAESEDVEMLESSSPDPLELLNQRIERNRQQLREMELTLQMLKSSNKSSQEMLTEVENAVRDEADEPTTLPPITRNLAQKKIQFQETGTSSDRPSSQTPANSSSQVQEMTTGSRGHPDPLTELACKKPFYPPIPDPSPKRPYFYRATWRIHISEKAETPEKGFVNGISEVWSVLKGADEKLIVYPWRQRNHGKYKALSSPKKLPDSKEGINRYFPDAYFRPQPGSMYLRVYMGTILSEEELGRKIHPFFGATRNRQRVGFWKIHLQFEDTTEIGWLYRSTPGMTPKIIQDKLFRHTGIHAAARWKMISTNSSGTVPDELKVKAIHLSVRNEDVNLAKAKFTKLIFARHRRSHFIGGSPMRLIPISRDLSPRNKMKCIHYIGKQSVFLAQLKSVEGKDILFIDTPVLGLKGRTLRELILEIPLRNNPSKQAFLSADRAFNKPTAKLFFNQENANECDSRKSTLLPYLIFTNPGLEQGIRTCFSGDANERAKGVKWDPVAKEVVTVDDEIFNGFDGWESDDDDKQSDAVKKFMIDLAAVSGVSLSQYLEENARDIKVQETDAASMFSKSTIRSKANATFNTTSSQDDSDMEEDDDTLVTFNRSTPTSNTADVSSITDGQTSQEIKSRVDSALSQIILSLTKSLPDTPENQVALANIRAQYSLQSAGRPSDSTDPGSTDSGALPR